MLAVHCPEHPEFHFGIWLQQHSVDQYLLRLLDYMDERGLAAVTLRGAENSALDDGIMDSLQSAYVQRDKHWLPGQDEEVQ